MNPAVQRQKTVAAHLKSKQLPLFALAKYNWSVWITQLTRAGSGYKQLFLFGVLRWPTITIPICQCVEVCLYICTVTQNNAEEIHSEPSTDLMVN